MKTTPVLILLFLCAGACNKDSEQKEQTKNYLLSSIRVNAIWIRFIYNVNNRLVQTQDTFSNNYIAKWDNNNNPLELRTTPRSSTLAAEKTIFDYDGQNRITENRFFNLLFNGSDTLNPDATNTFTYKQDSVIELSYNTPTSGSSFLTHQTRIAIDQSGNYIGGLLLSFDADSLITTTATISYNKSFKNPLKLLPSAIAGQGASAVALPYSNFVSRESTNAEQAFSSVREGYFSTYNSRCRFTMQYQNQLIPSTIAIGYPEVIFTTAKSELFVVNTGQRFVREWNDTVRFEYKRL